jgi:predicted GNAT family acetyltransferase
MGDVLDNPFWHALNTAHEPLAEINGVARRYPPEVAMMGGIDAFTDEAWHDLGELVGSNGTVLIARRDLDDRPAPWRTLFKAKAHQMVLDVELPAIEPPEGTRPLTNDDVPAMLALIALTEPGPFGPRTIELGGYVGIFEQERLVAMAGRRLSTDCYTEVSAVCTHPDVRRRGFGSTITALVAQGIVASGKTPMLHVAERNVKAQRVYNTLGFRTRTILPFRVLRSP